MYVFLSVVFVKICDSFLLIRLIFLVSHRIFTVLTMSLKIVFILTSINRNRFENRIVCERSSIDLHFLNSLHEGSGDVRTSS